jgi:cytochrome c7-like protein/cytochrome c554/c'-like protein
MTPIVLLAVALAIGGAADAGQPLTRCASCHFANMTTVPAPEHLGDWQRSAHARHGVGCNQCHGGDPWTYEPVQAHRGVLSPIDPASPVNSENLVRTCAPCHASITQAFSSGVHRQVPIGDARRAPTCTACHGVMSARVPSPAGLESRCGSCHPAGSRSDYAGTMRRALEALNVERVRADVLDGDIERTTDRTRRAELTIAVRDIRLALAGAVAAAHTFDIPAINERVGDARRRLDALER